MQKSTFKFIKHCRRIISRVLFFPFVLKDYFKYKSKDQSKRFELTFWDSWPFIFDKTISTPFDRHYIYHTAWAARKVKEINPPKHVDISSSLSFCSIVSAFVPVAFYDYRPANLHLDGLTSQSANLTSLHFESNSIHSLSCMHTIEHIGLGRYGDPIDPDGDIKAINELKRVVAQGGYLIFVTPIGKKKLLFNGMRIYSYDQIINLFKDLTLVEFSLIHEYEEDGAITINASEFVADLEEYGCGCFLFKK